jgi:hypothetical protein
MNTEAQQREMEEYERARQEEQLRNLRESIPTPSQRAAETARAIGQQQAVKSTARMTRTTTQKMMDDATVKKSIPAKMVPGLAQTHADNCRVMNAYRERYSGKINYVFAKNYHVDMDHEKLAAERVTVELELGADKAPEMLKDCILLVGQLVERVSIGVHPTYNFNKASDKLEAAFKSGKLDPEIIEVSIKYLPWFSLSAEARLFFAIARIYMKQLADNTGYTEASEEAQEAAEDL